MKQTLAELAETAVRNSGGELDDDISIAVLSRAEDDVLFPQDVTWLCACGARNRLENSYCVRCGRDFLTLYSRVSFAKYGGKTQFFRYANQHSTLERRFLDGIINQNK